jgi:hypothetical protein
MYTWVQSVITCPQSLKEPLTKPGYLAEFGGSWEMSKLSKIGKHFGIWSCFAMSVGTHVRCWSSKVCLLNRIWVCSKLGYLLGTLAIIFPAPRPQDCHGMPWHIPQFWANRDNTTLKVPQKLRSSPNWSPIWAKFPSLCWSHPGESHQEVPTPNPSGPTWPGKFPEIWTSNSTWGIFQQTMWLITRGYIR